MPWRSSDFPPTCRVPTKDPSVRLGEVTIDRRLFLGGLSYWGLGLAGVSSGCATTRRPTFATNPFSLPKFGTLLAHKHKKRAALH